MATAAGQRDVAVAHGLPDELRRSRAMLAETQQLARIGSWEWDIAANVLTWSDELFRIYGLEPQSFQPSAASFAELVPSDDGEAISAGIDQAMPHRTDPSRNRPTPARITGLRPTVSASLA